MTYEEFLATDPEAAADLPAALSALALDRAGRWEAAHQRAAETGSLETHRVHAYLHRKEGDAANARYWYSRVGETFPEQTLDEEWKALVLRFLSARAE